MSKVDEAAWERQFNGQVRLLLQVDEKILHEACDVLFARIVEKTPKGNPTLWKPPYWPKGYVPGTLKDSWEITHGKNEVIIQNQQPYALRVETGWSGQAPAGMMRVSLNEFNAILEQVANKYRK